jgi:AcrR family transcriptional regulator
MILEAAADTFAEEGFDASTRRLATRMGVTPALIYRYFDSKEDLIAQVFIHTFAEHWDESWAEILRRRKQPLAERISEFYKAYLLARDRRYLRLFLRGCLDGYGAATRYSGRLDEYVLKPILEQMRRRLDLPSLVQKPMSRMERELLVVLHAQMFYLLMRRHVFDMLDPPDAARLIDLHVKTYLPGALEQLAAIHADTDSRDAISIDRGVRDLV